MNWDIILAIVFYGLIIWFFLKTRDRWEVHGSLVGLYRTQLGLNLMGKIAKNFPKLLRFLSGISVFLGFAGMAFIMYYFVAGTYTLITVPKAVPALAPILPGIKIPGLPVLGFWHWIIAIFLVAVVHEFSHGVFSRLYNVKIKSSGFAFFGPILGAFVEPDEKNLLKKSTFHQLVVFSAGAFSNVLLAVVFLLILNFVTAPAYSYFYEGTGMQVNNVLPDNPAAVAGLVAPITVSSINNMRTTNFVEFVNATRDIKPGDNVVLSTDKGIYTVIAIENPDNKSKGFIGISDFELDMQIKNEIKGKIGTFIPGALVWLHMLVFWIFVVSFGVGLFNLLPLGPIDGGRMFYTAIKHYVKDEVKAKKIFGSVTLLCLLLIFINIIPYLWKLFVWISRLFI